MCWGPVSSSLNIAPPDSSTILVEWPNLGILSYFLVACVPNFCLNQLLLAITGLAWNGRHIEVREDLHLGHTCIVISWATALCNLLFIANSVMYIFIEAHPHLFSTGIYTVKKFKNIKNVK